MRVSILFVCCLIGLGKQDVWEEEKEEILMLFLSLYLSCE
jgi:hypothetical protein